MLRPSARGVDLAYIRGDVLGGPDQPVRGHAKEDEADRFSVVIMLGSARSSWRPSSGNGSNGISIDVHVEGRGDRYRGGGWKGMSSTAQRLRTFQEIAMRHAHIGDPPPLQDQSE